MIYDLSKQLDAELQRKGVPYRVHYGPERMGAFQPGDRTTSHHKPRIVIQNDQQGDVISFARSQHKNPKCHFTRQIGAIIRIYAQATIAGARVQDHRDLADEILDRVLVALDRVMRGERKSSWSVGTGAFVAPEDLAASESWSGAVYELRFTVDRAVFDRDWDGNGKPEAQFGDPPALGLTNTTVVSLVNGAGIPDTACGA